MTKEGATNRDQIALASLGYAYGRAGQGQNALDVLEESEERAEQDYVMHTAITWVHTGLGHNNEAFKCLEKALPEREEILVWINVAPFCDGLRSDPRFRDILCRMNFPM